MSWAPGAGKKAFVLRDCSISHKGSLTPRVVPFSVGTRPLSPANCEYQCRRVEAGRDGPPFDPLLSRSV